MKKLLLITNINIALGQEEFLIPEDDIESCFQMQFNMNCYLNVMATAYQFGSLKGLMYVTDVEDDNYQATIIDCSKQLSAWDTVQSNNLINLDANDKVVNVKVNKITHANSLLVVLTEQEYNSMLKVAGFDVDWLVQELLLSYLPISYDYELVER